jgi:hypothetical protein
MPSENALLDLISYHYSSPEPGIVEGTCIGLANLSIQVQESLEQSAIEHLRNEAKKRIEAGEIPQFSGKSRDLLTLSRVLKKKEHQFYGSAILGAALMTNNLLRMLSERRAIGLNTLGRDQNRQRSAQKFSPTAHINWLHPERLEH